MYNGILNVISKEKETDTEKHFFYSFLKIMLLSNINKFSHKIFCLKLDKNLLSMYVLVLQFSELYSITIWSFHVINVILTSIAKFSQWYCNLVRNIFFQHK